MSMEKEIISFKTSVFQRPLNAELIDPGSHFMSELPINHDALSEQVRERNVLVDHLENIFKEDLPNKTTKLDDIYSELNSFINRDQNNIRLILYLPFQLLPNVKECKTSDSLIFAKTVHDGWFKLLFESDVRANFNDGDDLEEGLGPLERVRKAAHLVSILIDKGIVDRAEVDTLIDISDDQEFISSLKDGLSVQIHNNFTTEVDNVMPINYLSEFYKGRISIINDYFNQGPNNIILGSKKRINWERESAINELNNETSDKLASLLCIQEIKINDLENTFDDNVIIRSLTKALINLSTNNQESTLLFNYLKSTLLLLWKHNNNDNNSEIVRSANYLYHNGLISADEANSIGINLINLEDVLPIDLNTFIEHEGKFLLKATNKIKNDPTLSKYLYPFILVFGSRIKGYSNKSADFDAAIFFKPEANYSKRDLLLSIINQRVPELRRMEQKLEYWIDNGKNGPTFKTLPEASSNIAGPSQIHFLLGGAWIGNEDESNKLAADLLKKYLDLDRFGEQKDEIRRELLRQIELDVTQYRIMHKGYESVYAPQKREEIANGEKIDWKSMFWDQKFREIATILFIKKVFLPDLSSNNGLNTQSNKNS